jgi:hypothetical protein
LIIIYLFILQKPAHARLQVMVGAHTSAVVPVQEKHEIQKNKKFLFDELESFEKITFKYVLKQWQNVLFYALYDSDN